MSLDITNLTKVYKHKAALDNVSLTFEPNHIYGLLGKNGAGKSTLLNIINNRIFASSGTVKLNGKSVVNNEKVQNHFFLMSETNLFPARLKINELFKLAESFYGGFDWKLSAQLLEAFDLKEKASFKSLSTGNRSIFKLIMALALPVDYVFLDEPVLGLDATNRDTFYRTLIDEFTKRQRTFIISTHLIEEVANIVDQVIIIDHGQIMENRPTDEIKAQGVTISGPKDIVAKFTADMEVIGADQLGGLISVYVRNFDYHGDLPSGVTVQPLNLQAYFVQATKRKEH